MKILVHYNEIGLKGKNRGFFESVLIKNIKEKINIKNLKKDNKRLIFEAEDFKELKNIFGISHFSIVEEVENKEEAILEKARELMNDVKSLGLKTSRSDKNFPLSSIELNTKIGEIANSKGIKIDFSNPEKVIYIEITSKKAYLYTERIKGLNGLPVGASGRVLLLFSGGIDSSLSAYLLMKRGCKVDFLHFHALKNNDDVLDSKIIRILKILKKYQTGIKLFLIPYHRYQLSMMDKVKDNLDVVLFRNFILRFAEEISKKYKYKAIATGDNLAQVASQTLTNLNASSYGTSLSILRPLLTFDKQEIIDLAKKIGTYEESIKEYKDCCSIISKKVNLNVKLEDIKEIKFNGLIEKSLEEMSIRKV